MQTMQSLGASQSTKWILPFEVSKVLEGMSEFLGVSRQTPAREVSDQAAVEKAVGKPDDVLGPIPSQAELRSELKALEDAMAKEKEEAEALGALGQGKPDKDMLSQ